MNVRPKGNEKLAKGSEENTFVIVDVSKDEQEYREANLGVNVAFPMTFFSSYC